MAGTKAGAAKAAQTNKAKYGPDYYARIAKNSWKNERSHETGFALIPREKLIELSAKGGKKTKDEYKTKETTDATEADKERPSAG